MPLGHPSTDNWNEKMSVYFNFQSKCWDLSSWEDKHHVDVFWYLVLYLKRTETEWYLLCLMQILFSLLFSAGIYPLAPPPIKGETLDATS